MASQAFNRSSANAEYLTAASSSDAEGLPEMKMELQEEDWGCTRVPHQGQSSASAEACLLCLPSNLPI